MLRHDSLRAHAHTRASAIFQAYEAMVPPLHQVLCEVGRGGMAGSLQQRYEGCVWIYKYLHDVLDISLYYMIAL